MSLSPIRKMMLGLLAILLFVVAACWRQTSPPSPQAWTMTLTGQWGTGANAPHVWPTSNQVIMTPTVMNLGLTSQQAQIAFVSFDTQANAGQDKYGVLRVIDEQGHEIATFPDPAHPATIPASCSTSYSNLNTVPHLSPEAGLALGKLLPNQKPFIIGVLDDHTTNQGGIIAFQLTGSSAGGLLTPLWCSQPLPAGDTIPKVSAPTIAQLDPLGHPPSIVLDNKVYDAGGHLRYTGFNSSGGNCATCPRSRTVIVANLTGGPSLPQIITGNAIYKSTLTTSWTGPTGTNTPFALPGFTGAPYPAIADLDGNSTPEIVVTDPQVGVLPPVLRVYSAAGVLLSSLPLPNPLLGLHCGGPPMIVDVDNDGLPEIGVASCNRYTLFKYYGGALHVFWTTPINDPSGAATSTAFKDSTGLAKIYYADSSNLYVFNGLTGGAPLQSTPNPSGTAIEGPIIAAFDTGTISTGGNLAPGHLVVSANNTGSIISGFGPTGIRIFSDPAIGLARSVWNAHTYHRTNVTSSFGDIPNPEPASWLAPVNSYRVQQQ
jgi:hypothetical protein